MSDTGDDDAIGAPRVLLSVTGTRVWVWHHEQVGSTQDVLRSQLRAARDSDVRAVSAEHQRAGRGRQGRAWHSPAGDAVLLSVGRRGPWPAPRLDGLARRAVDAVLATVAALPGGGGVLVWNAPNDVIDAVSGAKVGGVLIDSRTTGAEVDELIVGVGINVGGAPFTLDDGRAVTTLEAVTGAPIDLAGFRDALTLALAALLDD